MTGKITITELRNIKRLEFTMPKPGVRLLCAGNGAGKTSLLGCLRRIGYPQAFATHFPSSIESDRLDNFAGANISYSIGNRTVNYAYGGARWTPRPRRNSKLLNQFGYPSVIYVGATADRITPRPDDFEPVRVRKAPADIIEAANKIFETNKFDDLKTINLTTGAGNRAYLLKVKEHPAAYHSEKNFSLGELCVLKLLEKIGQCPEKSLVLIDELEMALHPRAQIQLYNYLVSMASSKNLTVLFSTHSVSLLKVVPREMIIFLERNIDNEVVALEGCFPTFALGNITLGEERAPDVVFYVEDEMAREIVEALIKEVSSVIFDNPSMCPTTRVAPIGGYDAVIRFLHYHGAMLPQGTRCCALLDQDVQAETLAKWEVDEDHEQLAILKGLGEKIAFLPWTPEVGLIECFQQNRVVSENMLRRQFDNNLLVLKQELLNSINGFAGKERRKRAKKAVGDIINDLSVQLARPKEAIRAKLCAQFVVQDFEHRRDDILNLIAPKLR
ncbi:AAA family ATPase [Thalassospira australica]|uniref:AAA family ATPase n=1 Tax=Thalassospira australica TaxID=1528106 RepID=UPI00384D55E3